MIEAIIAVKEKEIEQNRQRQDTLTVSLDQANENLMQVSKQMAKMKQVPEEEQAQGAESD